MNQDGSRLCPGTRGETEALADRYFIETAIRQHRADKGAPYTGIRPAEADFGPAILAAEWTVESGDFKLLEVLLVEEVRRALQERLAQAQSAQAASMKSDTRPGVRATRNRVRAELGFIGFIERLYLTANPRTAVTAIPDRTILMWPMDSDG